ncbi:UNC-50 [Dipodascopsis tothii]|uniref:UNC-50 n=1 Tax=Dipodascopsis tothii TaxID=44089 RepID=UPI0034CE16C2
MATPSPPPGGYPRRGRLPRTTSSPGAFTSIRLPIVLRRLFKPPTLDFETAVWEICYLLVAPKKVYRQIYYHVKTKNTWARDDPSFMILLSLFLVLSAVAWGVAYAPGFGPVVKLMFNMVLVDFLGMGVIVSTVLWAVAGRFLKQANARGVMNIGAEGTLEWAYCFDVHCNGFLVIWLFLYVIQYVLLPIITLENWFAMFLGNTLYLAAFSYYFVITYLGYSALPFLEHTEYLLAPLLVFVVVFLVSLSGWNIAQHVVRLYFGA